MIGESYISVLITPNDAYVLYLGFDHIFINYLLNFLKTQNEVDFNSMHNKVMLSARTSSAKIHRKNHISLNTGNPY
jgi:hypothetical protein